MSRTFSNFISPNVVSDEAVAVSATNPTFGDNAGWRNAFRVTMTVANPADGAVRQLASNPNFSNHEGFSAIMNGDWGSNFYGAGTNAKWTFLATNSQMTMRGSGQKIVSGSTLVSHGMGDNCLSTGRVWFGGGPTAGDEGTGFNLVTLVSQNNQLSLVTLLDVDRATLDTTLTQEVVADDAPQTVTVASTTGCSPGDWLVIQQTTETGLPNLEAIQVISVPASGQINAIFAANHPNGSTVKPALILTVNNGTEIGELRTIVNRDGAVSYSTGTVASIAGGGFVGSGTAWSVSMVGGDAHNIGAICLDADTITDYPFDGTFPNDNHELRAWYNITSVTDATHLGIHTWSVAGDQAYHSTRNSPGAGGYEIRPAVRCLRNLGGGVIVCEYTATTWTVGDIIECVLCPFPDVSGHQYHLAVFTPGGVRRRALVYTNTGLQKFDVGYELSANGPVDGIGWSKGMYLSGIDTGIQIVNAQDAALLLGSEAASGFDSDDGGKIDWNGPYIKPNSTNEGMDLNLVMAGTGVLSSLRSTINGFGNNLGQLKWSGAAFGTAPTSFANLPAAAAGLEGVEANVTDSSTATWGATVTGGGANKVKVRCNGTAWTVVGI